MTLPHRLIIDGVEQCASDDAGVVFEIGASVSW